MTTNSEVECAAAARSAILQASGELQKLISRHELRTGHVVSRETPECGLLDCADAAIAVCSLLSFALQGVVDALASSGE